MIIGFFGNVRQGKTLGAVAELYKYYQAGYNIYSNTALTFPHKLLTIQYMLSVVNQGLDVEDNSVFFIDEIPIWLDSRSSTSALNRIMSYFLLQTGKMGINTDYGLILIYTAQFGHLIDKRLRSVTDIAVACSKIKRKDTKIFIQKRYFLRGKKSFSYRTMLKEPENIYKMYSTRLKIKALPQEI